MIEKLDKYLAKNINSYNMSQNIMVAQKAIEKINELCDVVNEQQRQIEKVSFAILDLATPNGENKALESIKAESKTPVDPYAEQRRWIGKLCRFWDSVYDRYYFNTLKGITDEGLFIGHNGVWKHCEPVKPDDDIIYKGGNDEL